jgi:hypothetical protein
MAVQGFMIRVSLLYWLFSKFYCQTARFKPQVENCKLLKYSDAMLIPSKTLLYI